MNTKNLEALADVVVNTVKSAIEGPRVSGRIQELEARLEARIAALESRPLLKWAGTFVEGQEYAEAQLVTRSGSLWLSTAATKTTLGTPGSDWRLVVKKGDVR